MKSIQTGTPAFVLTSLSFKTAKTKKAKQQQWPQNNSAMHSSIVKFDYCLPPDEFNSEHDSGIRTA